MSRTDEPLLSGYPGRVFIAIAVGWLGLRIGRGLLPPLLPTIIDGLSITPFLAGVALSAMSALSAACQYLGGRAADELSRKTVLAASLVVLCTGFAVLSVAGGYPLFVAGVAVLGAGTGLFFIPMRAALADLYVERRGRAFGVNESVGSAGTVVAAGLAVVVIRVSTWRRAFLPALLIAAAGLVVLHGWHREPYLLGRVRLDLRGTARRVLGDPSVRLLLVSYSLVLFSMQGAYSFLPALLQAEKGFSPTLASASYAAIFVVGVVTMPLVGGASDGRRRTAVAAAALLVAVLGLAGFLLAPSAPLVVAGVLVFAAGLLGYPPVMQAHLLDRFPDGSMGGDFGGFKTVYVGVGSLGPAYVGYAAERAGYAAAYAGLAACLLASAAVVAWLARAGR